MTILERTPDALVLGGDGPAVGLRIVILAATDHRPLTLSTFLRFHRVRWRPVIRLLLIGHRRVVPLLLDRVAARSALEHSRRVTA